MRLRQLLGKNRPGISAPIRKVNAQIEPYRPSAVLFVQIFGMLIDAYQRALDRGREFLAVKKEPPLALPVEQVPPKKKLEWFRPSDRTGPKPGF